MKLFKNIVNLRAVVWLAVCVTFFLVGTKFESYERFYERTGLSWTEVTALIFYAASALSGTLAALYIRQAAQKFQR